MSKEQFDQYVTGMFANETVQPPAGAEDALFQRMSKLRKQKRQIQVLGTTVVICVGVLIGAHVAGAPHNGAVNATDGIRPIVPSTATTATDAIEPVPQQEDLSQPMNASAESEVTAGPSGLERNSTVVSDSPSEGNDFSIEAEANLEGKRSPMHQIDALPATTAAYDSGERSLQAPEEETWVLPAVVKVKD
ncbi:hypothetical protein OAF30_02390 [Flavobacteriales bacterium]|nr:hypothetical protein [Flavobacteriales bacterium]